MASQGEEVVEAATTAAGGDAPSAPSTWAKAREASHQMILQAAMEDLESKASKVAAELIESQTRAEQQEKSLTSMRAQVELLQASVDEKSTKLQAIQSDYQDKLGKCQSLEETSKSNGERMDRLDAEADALREEISLLNKSKLEYKEKLLDLETQAKLGDSEVVPLRYQVQRLTSEVDSISTHSRWLESELQSKNEQLASVRATHASEIAELRSDLDATMTEKESLSGQSTNLGRQLDQVNGKMERLSKELRETRQEASDSTLAMEQELVASQRVVSLQKTQMERFQQRHDSMASQMEALQRLAKEAEQAGNMELQDRERELEERTKQVLQDQAQDYQHQLTELKEQVESANNRCKQAEDGLLRLVPSRRTAASPYKPLAIKDKGIGEGDEDDEPLNLTDLHGRLAEAQDRLAAETLRRKKAVIRVSRIEAEIEAQAPLLIRQRQEYELAMERLEKYKIRLDEALSEKQASRGETSDLEVELRRLQLQNKELSNETSEMAKQVQTLLVSRSTSLGSGESSEIPASVVEMQTTNQRLLKEHRRFTSKIEELESKLRADTLRTKVETYEKELVTLREDRRRQHVLVEGIVQQRDLYRALLSKQDSNLLGSPSEEASALQIVKHQSERTKTLEIEKSGLESELAKSHAELSIVARDKEATSERLARYESLNAEITSTMDRLQLQVSSSKADVARSGADAEFHREKSARLEEALQRSRDEGTRVSAFRNDMQRINANLQTAMSKANADASKYESESQQAKMKLRLAETQAEAARAAEHRITEESKQLRIDISKQGALIESIQRIEANFSSKSAAEEDSFKSQIASLTEKLSTGGSKHTADLESLKITITDQDIRIKELEEKSLTSAKEALDAKKESLNATAEQQKLTKKCSLLEAQLRTAKKKLGETAGEEQDVEAELQSKILSITEELEASRKEAETLKERVATYQKLAKDNETALAELTSATNEAKKAQEEELDNLKKQLEVAHSETAKRKEMISELTNDLASQSEERSQAVEELNKKVSGLQEEALSHQTDAAASESRYTQLAKEVEGLKSEMTNAQNNYERELTLHATARTDLRAAREEAEAELRLRKSAEEEAATAKSELAEQRLLSEQEKSSLENILKEYEKNIGETRAQNALLHSQLEAIGDQIEKMQSGKVVESSEETISEGSPDELSSLRKTVSEFREVVKFLRSEKDMVQAQLDSSRRAAERERATATVAKRSLDDARAELKVLQEKSIAVDSGNAAEADFAQLKEKIRSAEEQSRLLGDSNSHLRDEAEKQEKKLSSLMEELETLKKGAQPSEKRQRELEFEKAGLVAEKESLLREVGDWKGRVQSLVSKFNQIDPEEHAKVVHTVESLEKELKTVQAKKTAAEEESKRIRTLASRASKQLMENKNQVETHKKAVAKLTAEKEALVKAQKDTTSKKEVSDLKERVAKLERERATEKIQLTGATEMNEKLRERLRQFQKKILEHRKTEASLKNHLKESQAALEKQKQDAAASGPSQEIKEASTQASSAPQEPVPQPKTAPVGTEKATTENKTASSTEKLTPPIVTLPEPSVEALTAEKKTEKVMPKVPAGGFKFGPSDTAEASSPTKEQAAKKPAPTEAAQKPSTEAANPSGAVPSTASSTGQVSKKRPAETSIDVASEKKRPAVDSKAGKTPVSGQSAGEQAVGAPSESTAEAPKPVTGRRNSGENKETSMKERLLEKKRKLMLAMKKKTEEKVRLAKAAEKEEEPAAKRSKVDETPAAAAEGKVGGSSPAVSAPTEEMKAEEVATKPSGDLPTNPSGDQDENDEEEGEVEETPEGDTAAESAKEEPTVPAPAAATSGSTPANPFGAGTGITNAFGSNAFGQAAAAASTFGQTSGFGSGTAFGAAASGGASVFGKMPEASVSAGAFGGSFLNMKPPSSSTAPPQFTFGASGSITLPTPATVSPQASMFNAFASKSSTPFSTAKPLFAEAKKEEKPDDAKTEDQEEGEMEDSEEAEPDV